MTLRLAALIALLAPLAAAAATPAAAGASTARIQFVTIEDDDDFDREDTSETYAILRYTARRGEANRVALTRLAHRRVLVSDRGARIRTGRRCKRRTLRSAICRLPGNARYARLSLGDRDDRAIVSSKLALWVDGYGSTGDDRLTGGSRRDSLSGGPGDDRLHGRRGSDSLSGGSGEDRLSGSTGADRLTDGPGNDRVFGGAHGDVVDSLDGTAGTRVADRFDGGDGRDEVSYGRRRRPIDATLGSTGGEAGESDRLIRIERLTGGPEDDLLTGDDAANRLTGGGGDDRYDGRGGSDAIYAAYFTDDAGDVTCGAGGGDLVHVGVQGRQLLQPDCERVRTLGYSARPRAQVRDVTPTTVTVEQPCAATFETERTVLLETPPAGVFWSTQEPFATKLGEGTRPQGPSSSLCPTLITLTEAGRQVLAARGRGPVTVRSLSGFGVTWSALLTPAG